MYNIQYIYIHNILCTICNIHNTIYNVLKNMDIDGIPQTHIHFQNQLSKYQNFIHNMCTLLRLKLLKVLEEKIIFAFQRPSLIGGFIALVSECLSVNVSCFCCNSSFLQCLTLFPIYEINVIFG